MPEGKISQDLLGAMLQDAVAVQRVVVQLEEPSSAAADNLRRVQLGLLFCKEGDGVTVRSQTVFTGTINAQGIETLARRDDVVGVSLHTEAIRLG